MSMAEQIERQRAFFRLSRSVFPSREEYLRWVRDGVKTARASVLGASRGNKYREGWMASYIVAKRLLREET